jgi:hypothetical protein
MYIYNPHMFIYFPHPRRPVRRWSSDKLKAGSACCTNVRTLVGTNNGVLMVVHGLFTVLSYKYMCFFLIWFDMFVRYGLTLFYMSFIVLVV